MSSPREEKLPILVLDLDANFLVEISKQSQTGAIKVVTETEWKAAQLQIAKSKDHFSAIVFNPEIDLSALDTIQKRAIVISAIRAKNSAVPLYLLLEKNSPKPSSDELKKLNVHDFFTKPTTYDVIAQRVAPRAFAIHGAMRSTPPFPEPQEDQDFYAIEASRIVLGSSFPINLYIRLGPHQFIKFLNAGEKPSSTNSEKYKEKGVKNFYIAQSDQEKYLAFCDSLANAALKSETLSPDVKLDLIMKHGKEALQFLRTNGINEANIEYATQFASNVTQHIKRLGNQLSPHIYKFLENIEHMDHGASTAMMASLLAKTLDIATSKPMVTVGMTTLLHDIGFIQMPDSTHFSEDQSKMTPEEIVIYHNHPLAGAEILKSIPGMDGVSIQAVAQHHERRNKKGFPHKLGTGSINRISEIIGLSDEFVNLMVKQKSDPSIQIQHVLENEIFDGFSRSIVEAFVTTFKPFFK